MKTKNVIWISVVWAIFITISYSWNSYIAISNIQRIVENKAESFFSQILVSRAWNSSHGGVYVPVTDITKPNPYLTDSLRDITTTSGMKLTKINPAYMTRQIAEINKIKNDLQFHITSLNPLRPANKADKWETKALKSFGDGTESLLELVKSDSISMYRYMAPLLTEKSCLKCHAVQGYNIDDIRGGISISFPSHVYEKSKNRQLLNLSIVHLLFFFAGLSGLFWYFRTSNKFYAIIEQKNQMLEADGILLRKSNQDLQESLEWNRAIIADKDRFMSILAHDLRGPFISILGYLELLSENVNKYDIDTIKKQVLIINNSAQKAFNLLDDILLWARSQSGKIPFNPKDLTVTSVFDEVLEILKPSASFKNITISQHDPQSSIAYADPEMLKTVLRNLISNAIKFTSSGGQIDIRAIQTDTGITISVSDDGIGLTKEAIGKLFDITNINSTPGTQKESGTGLGLFLCKEFIEKHGGKLWVESEVGKGSSFIFSLPGR